MTPQLNQMIHRILAKEVEYAAAYGRQFDFAFPRSYAMGMSARTARLPGDRYWLVLRLRIDDVSHTFQIKLPGAGHGDTDFSRDLARAATEIVCRYLDAHPKLKPSGAAAAKVLARLSREDFEDEAHRKAVEACEHSIYEMKDQS